MPFFTAPTLRNQWDAWCFAIPLFMYLLFLLAALIGNSSFHTIALHAQKICSWGIPDGPFYIWQRALVCGISIQDPGIQSFHHLGLSHLIVVSGAHLIFLENMLCGFLGVFGIAKNSRLIFILLIAYSFFAGLQPPLVRALFQRGPFQLSSLNVLLSGVLSWIFFRELSMSLVLSWACALMISWPSIGRLNPWVQSLLIYIGLFPVLLILSPPSLLAVVVNPVAAFIFGGVLFPVTVLNLILPLSDFCDFFWRNFLWTVDFLSLAFPKTLDVASVSLALYILILQGIHLRLDIHTERRKMWE